MTRRKIFLIVLIFVLIAPIVWVLFILSRIDKVKTGINVQVVPNGAQISINNKMAKEGLTKTPPGATHIEVTLKGFEPITQDIDVGADQIRFVGVALVPNTPETADWYDKHPKDKIEAEGLSSLIFVDISKNIAKKQPFVKDLPYIGPADEYRIDYGPDPSSKSTDQVIYITAGTQVGKDDALSWIRNQGYDPTTMTILYKNP